VTDAGFRLSNEIGRLVGAQGGVHACMSGLRMAIPLLALHLDHGAAVAGVLVALFGVAQLIATVPASRLADRYGLRRPVYCGAIAAFLGAMVAAMWPALPGLGIAALLEGGAVAIVVVAVQRHAGRLAHGPEELRQVFSWTSFTPAAANFIGPLLAGVAIDAFGFRSAFLLLGAGPLVAWAFVRAAREIAQPIATETQRPSAKALLRDATVRRLLLMNWFVSATWDVHAVMVPLLAHARGLNASTVGGVLGSMAIAAAVVRLVMPWMGTHVREWVWVSSAFAIAAMVLGVYPLTNSALTMGACSLVLGAAIGSVQPLVMSLLHQITPPSQHGQAVALRLVMVNASSISTPVFAGAAGGLAGAAAVFWIGAASLLVGARMAMRLRYAVVPTEGQARGGG
jgi:MFS family permease